MRSRSDAATLVYLAGQNVVTPHVWLSRADRPREPDRLILDFDPSGGGFADVRAAAREAGERLRDAGLVPYAMVTGSRGVHVVCPLRRGPGFSEVHGFARAMAEEMVADDPERLTLEWKKVDRGRQDLRGREPQRLRAARRGARMECARGTRAPVAVPLRWEELSDRNLRPDRWNVRNVADRMEEAGDPWQGMGRRARKLPAGD